VGSPKHHTSSPGSTIESRELRWELLQHLIERSAESQYSPGSISKQEKLENRVFVTLGCSTNRITTALVKALSLTELIALHKANSTQSRTNRVITAAGRMIIIANLVI
jgi:hypothetical protein